jgi:hypothetical protein
VRAASWLRSLTGGGHSEDLDVDGKRVANIKVVSEN